MILVLIAFFFSGTSALIYQLSWIRLIELAFGSSTAAVSTVLAAFMGGLALGAAIVPRWNARRRWHPLVLFALLEIGIALLSRIVPLGIRGAEALYATQYGIDGPEPTAVLLRLLLALAVLVAPTLLMGATFPVLVGAARRTRHEAWRGAIGTLYGINTFGAVLGVTAAGFWLLARFGLAQTLWIACGLNVVSALLVLAGRRRVGGLEEPRARGADRSLTAARQTGTPSAGRRTGFSLPPAAVLVAVFLTGFTALAGEVVWSRVLRLSVAGTIYSVTIMLVAFLCGIAGGGLAASGRGARARRWIPALLMAMGVATVATIPLIFSGVRILSAVADLFGGGTWTGMVLARLGVAAAVMFVPAFLSGLLFPLLVAARGAGDTDGDATARAAGEVYAVNTIGGVAGSLAAGFLLIPTLGTQGTVAVAAAALLLLGTVLFVRQAPLRLGWRLALAGAAILTALLVGRSHAGQFYLGKIADRERVRVLHYEEGIGASVIAVEDLETGHLRLFTNGTFAVDTSFESQQTVALLGHLPALLAGKRERALVIGFGMGTTPAAVAAHPFREIACVEIIPGVFDVAGLFSAYNHDVLTDPRVRTVVDDGRAYLSALDRRYDVITCDPIHPAFGSPALYTREYYELCRSRLSPHGVMVQYLPLHQLSNDDFRLLMATFADAFPHSAAFLAVAHGVLVGSPNALVFDPERVRARLAGEGVRDPQEAAVVSDVPTPGAELARVGIDSAAKLLACLALDTATIARIPPPPVLNADDRPRLEFSEARSYGRNTRIENLEFLLARPPELTGLLPPAAREESASAGFLARAERAQRARRHLLESMLHHARDEMRAALEAIRRADQVRPQDLEIETLGGTALPHAHLMQAERILRRLAAGPDPSAAPPDAAAREAPPDSIVFQEVAGARAAIERARELAPEHPLLPDVAARLDSLATRLSERAASP